MALLNVSNLKKSFGTDLLFDGVSFEMQENDKIGLVGVNGSGKTTLFKLFTGEANADDGEIFLSKNAVVGYMEQHVCRSQDETAYSEVLTVFSGLMQIERDLELLAAKINQKPQDINALIEKQAALNDTFVQNGGLTYKSRARSALLGLGFTEEQMNLRVGALSGGQKAKLQLAKMLLCGANLMLLDEPTNHLDIASVEWLEEYLKNCGSAYIVISHDRYFLDKITARTFELENRRLTVYKGNYTAYTAQKAENRLAADRVYENTAKEIKRLEGIVAQQRQWNREKNIKTAESKLKVIDRLEKNLEKPDAAPDSIHFRFEINQAGGNDVLTSEGLSLSFHNKALFQDVDLQVHRGERIFLLGPNGCGKTSLFKTLLKEYTPGKGTVRFGAGVETGYYDQLQAGLDPAKTVIDEIWDKHPRMTQTEVRSALAVFLFRGDDVFKPVSALSGGERARVLLLQLMLSRANFLLLDEPTNHLDIASREALEGALESYEGTLFIISHDRYLINKLADRIYYLNAQGAAEYIGNYDAYSESVHKQAETAKAKTEPPKSSDYKLRKERESELRKLKTRLTRTEAEIEQVEKRIEQINEAMCQPETAANYEKTMELSADLQKQKEAQDMLYQTWGCISEELEDKMQWSD